MDKVYVEKVSNMRRLQRNYFRDRDHLTLQACKKAEREVDTLTAGYLKTELPTIEADTHPKLF